MNEMKIENINEKTGFHFLPNYASALAFIRKTVDNYR